ncbi:hypothetical protein PR048_003331 [Dryococelus australis]|uniref:Uncharacterized protein n=1 Tax=Dryococelus australis TaxID=614101 RepID=A0ABQ9IMT9_9NEOP|nr:hypothetical protein PR048_003331 [Dryococelus australis]
MPQNLTKICFDVASLQLHNCFKEKIMLIESLENPSGFSAVMSQHFLNPKGKVLAMTGDKLYTIRNDN